MGSVPDTGERMTGRPPGGKPPGGRSALRWVWIAALVVVTAIGWAPLASVVATGIVAGPYGCRVDEGSVHPCPTPYGDLGPLLYAGGMMGWFMLITFPLMLGTLVLWPILIVTWIRRRGR